MNPHELTSVLLARAGSPRERELILEAVAELTEASWRCPVCGKVTQNRQEAEVCWASGEAVPVVPERCLGAA